MVSCQGAGPQQVGEGAGEDTPLRRLQRQQGRPPLAPARKERTGPQLRLRGPPLREPDAPTSPTGRRPDARPHSHHAHQPLTTGPTGARRESPSGLRPITTTTTNHLDPSPVRRDLKEQGQATGPTSASTGAPGDLRHPQTPPRDHPAGPERPGQSQRGREGALYPARPQQVPLVGGPPR